MSAPGTPTFGIGNDVAIWRLWYRENTIAFNVAKGERIAGRKAVRIKIEPKDMYRFGYVMEVDLETALLLKTSTIGHSGKTLERFQFAKLTYSESLPEGVEVDVVHEAQHSGPGVPDTRVPLYSTLGDLVGCHRVFTPTDAPASNAARKTYTDGLAVFSVFMEELDRGIQPGEGVIRNGSTTSYSRGMQIAGQSILTTVIGEVPVNTARMVADSITWTH